MRKNIKYLTWRDPNPGFDMMSCAIETTSSRRATPDVKKQSEGQEAPFAARVHAIVKLHTPLLFRHEWLVYRIVLFLYHFGLPTFQFQYSQE